MQKNISKFYFYKLFNFMNFWVPVFVLFFQSKQLNFTMIMSLTAIQSIFQLGMEIPSGMFADFFGRKRTMFLSTVISLAAFILLVIGKRYLIFLFGYALFGLAMAFRSGTDSAFLYDTLKNCGREREYKRIEGIAYSFGMLGMGIGSVIGGFLASVSLGLPLIFTIITVTISLIIVSTFSEPLAAQTRSQKGYLIHFKDAAVKSFQTKKIKAIILFMGFMFSILLISHRFYQPYLKLNGIALKYFGLIYLGWLLVSTAGSRYAHFIEGKLGFNLSIVIIPFSIALHLLLISVFSSPLGILYILPGQFAWGFLRPITLDYINTKIESSERATIISIQGFVQGLMLIILSPILGYLADVISLQQTLLTTALLVLVVGLPLVIVLLRLERRGK